MSKVFYNPWRLLEYGDFRILPSSFHRLSKGTGYQR